MKRQDVEVALAGRYVEVIVPQGGNASKRIPAAKWWFDSPTKTVFDRVLYDPENRLLPAGEKGLNLWNGFAVQPRAGTWRRMRRHIWLVICGRNRVAFKYFLRWMAFCLQFPGTNPEVMIVLRSDLEGVGKSSVGQWLLTIFGGHGVEITNYKSIFGDFNDQIENKSFFCLKNPCSPATIKPPPFFGR